MKTVRIGGGAVAGLGFLALLGWASGLPFLAGLGADKIPMAPSTALLFVLYGVATLLRARPPLGRGARRVGVAVSSVGALVAALLLVLSFLGIRPAAELLGLRFAGTVGGAPVGHMSPVTAMCFLLVSLSFLASLPTSSSRPWRAEAAWWSAALLLAIAGVLLLAYLFGSPLFYGGPFIPPAATTGLAFAALGIALLGLAGRKADPAGERAGPPASVPYPVVLVFVLLGAGIVIVGGIYLRSQARHYRAQMEDQLSVVAELKKDELVQWRSERLGDASLFLGNQAFAALAGRVLDDPQDAESREQVRGWLTKAQTHYAYDRVSFLDAVGAERLAVPGGRTPESSVIARRVPEVLRSRKVTFQDFHRNEYDQRIYLSVLAPVLDAKGGGRELGIVALRIDPETYLYPLINRWPTPARTAETLLVRRDGSDALFLNELRFRKRTALTARIPLANREVVAAKAALGQEGIVEGIDYRGASVVAAIRAVPESPWSLVARIDADELNAPLRERLWVLVLAVGGMLAGAAAGVGFVTRGQRVRHLGERLEAQRERAWMQDVIARSSNEIYAFDPETLRFRFANLGACRNIGCTEEELAGLTPLDIEPDLTAETFRARLEPLRAAGQPVHAYETIHRRKDGTTYPVEVRLQLVDTGAGAVFLSIVNDITERKHAEASILKEQAFSEAMLNSIPGIIYLFDNTGRFLRWNHSFETVSGYSAREIAAMHPLDFFVGQDRTVVEESIGRVFESGKADLETALASKDGRRTPYYFVGVRIAVDGVPCCIGTGFDVTARKLVEAQLQQSQKIEAIGRLAGGVAHDFNNLIAVITGYGEMAQDELGPEHPVRARVDEMIKAARRAADVTQQLLAFSRKQVTQPKVLDLNRIVADTQKMLGRLIGEDVDVVIHAAAGLGAVKADPGQIAQIILNLAVNARDAMPKGGSLTIETANVDLDEDYAAAHSPATPGRYVVLAVSDTGIGMDEETQRRIFEPFFTTKLQGQGTGLGLATVYGIVKQSDGFIWVYSEPGHGTTFKVYLPRVGQKAAISGASAALAEEYPGTETILVAEDTEELREVIRETLEKRGYTVLLASNGEEALKLAREHTGPIPLLLSDVVMPKLGGGELGKQLSALRPGIRVLYMSGYTDGVISQHGVLKEGVRLLQKPFTGRKLAQAVREALDAPGAEPPVPGEAMVLLVEDDLQVRTLMGLLLKGAGYRVESVGTVAAASEALGSGREYAVVLCDLTLPDGSGEDVVRRVREARPELRDRVLVLTGGAMDEVRGRLVAAGVTEILTKPVAGDLLLQRVAAVAGGKLAS